MIQKSKHISFINFKLTLIRRSTKRKKNKWLLTEQEVNVAQKQNLKRVPVHFNSPYIFLLLPVFKLFLSFISNPIPHLESVRQDGGNGIKKMFTGKKIRRDYVMSVIDTLFRFFDSNDILLSR